MKKNKEKISSTANLIKAAVAILFAISLGVAVNVLHTGEEDTTTTAFATQLDTFKRHVVSSHWQWRVRQPTTMIMLIHYDESRGLAYCRLIRPWLRKNMEIPSSKPAARRRF